MALHPDAFPPPAAQLVDIERRLADPSTPRKVRLYLEERALVLRAAHPELQQTLQCPSGLIAAQQLSASSKSGSTGVTPGNVATGAGPRTEPAVSDGASPSQPRGDQRGLKTGRTFSTEAA